MHSLGFKERKQHAKLQTHNHGLVCRWFFPCNEWLSKEKGWSQVLPAQLTDPRSAASLVEYQVTLWLAHRKYTALVWHNAYGRECTA